MKDSKPILVIASRNDKKAYEIRVLLKKLRVQVVTLRDFPSAPHVREDGKTFRDNAIKKALTISRYTRLLAVADDSGLEVDILGGAPGVRSARFTGSGATDTRNNRKVLRLLGDLPMNRRGGAFKCAVAIARSGKLLGVVEGSCRGKIGFKMIGRIGFGYDEIFIPVGYRQTFGQLGYRIKHRLSHRSKALKKAVPILKKHLGAD
ncbi:MAG: non-canonical purine NTP pyrophosphatase [Candidatus Omnitrophica bacterium]|nr:non-canonical purine NTP pyrophosphatase [Candidatus Omnitrophota bacterium]